ncbi:MAG: IS110 family transposase [Mycobacteriales bacterium]
MTIVAHAHPFVIGVDTHARSHALTVLACPHGELVDSAQFPTTAAGITRAVDWAARRTGGDVQALWVIEGIGTYGAQLARAVAVAGYQVVEATTIGPGSLLIKSLRWAGKAPATHQAWTCPHQSTLQ